MNKSIHKLVTAIFFSIVFSPMAFAGEQEQKIDHSGHIGSKIHESVVADYQFAYHLIDRQELTKSTKEMDKSHHMMVYIIDPEGRKVEEAKVGYLVKGPDGSTQKLMTMGMQGAYGADLNFKIKGTYTVKMKAVTGEKKLLDTFTYEVE